MTATYQSVGTVGVSTATATPGLPPGLTDGDLVLLMVIIKFDTATIDTPAGWTPVANVAGGGGSNLAGTGPTRQAWFYRVKDASWSTAPTATQNGGASGNALAAILVRVSGSGSYDIAAATGIYGAAGAVTNAATTLGSDPGITSGDLLLCGYSGQDEAPTWSAESVTAPGVTIGAATEQSEAIGTTSGNDLGGMIFTASATAGTSTGAPTTAATSSVANRGTVALVRVRESVPAPPDPPPSPIVDGQARITRITHRITGDKWLTTFGFTVEGGVAQPQVTPSPTPSGGKTLSELLRPVGEVTMWYGASGAVPAGWLLCNGSAFSGTDYPELAALLGGTTTPNMVDVFPIGAGTKALGTNGGAPTKTIAAANLPSHSHDFSRATALGSTGTFPRGAATDGTTTSTGATGVAATPMDVMPPWRALHFIIRAR